MAAFREVPACAHRMTYRVCYADTDQMARVYYANYLVWFERARTEALRAANVPYAMLEERGMYLPVRKCELQYRGYAVYDQEVTLASWVTRIGRMGVTMTTMVLPTPQEPWIVAGSVELVCVNRDGKPQPLPDDVATALRPYLSE